MIKSGSYNLETNVVDIMITSSQRLLLE